MSLRQPFHRLMKLFGWLWGHALDAAAVVWITRVSVISVVVGGVLFIAIPPVRDTFLDMRGDSPFLLSNIWRWALFFFSAVLFWALPVH
ncbi:MAG: hypothetical protein WBB50_10245, partial [Methyloceanibacter sp.]